MSDDSRNRDLSTDEIEALASELNSPILEPLVNPPAGFKSKHDFRECDIAQRIASIDWFANCGNDITVDLTMPIRLVESWSVAVAEAERPEWENTELEAQNQLSVWLHHNARNDFQKWNDLVQQHKSKVLTPLIDTTIAALQARLPAAQVLVPSVQWDILGAMMENSYIHLRHPAVFFLELLMVYESGHFPCGWDGDWPDGKLLVY